MISRLAVTLGLLAVAVGAAVFELKANVLVMNEQLSLVESAIRKERHKIQTLEADWAHVSRPDRLVQLAHEVGMVRAGVLHVASLDRIGRRAMLELTGLSFAVPLGQTGTGTFRVKPLSRSRDWEDWQ